MNLLPIFLRVKLCHKNWWMPTLWLPLFLLWPFLFVLIFVIFFVGLVAVVILDTRSVRRFFSLFGGIYLTLCALRGTKVDVEHKDNQIFIAID